MSDQVYLKTGDTKPDLSAQLFDEAGDPIDVSGADVRFSMRSRDTVVIDEGAVVIVTAAEGKVLYVWAAGSTDDPGTYLGEFVVIKAGRRTVPNNGHLTIVIEESI